MPVPRKHETDADRQRAYRERRKRARLQAPGPEGLPATSPIRAMPSKARWKELRRQAETAMETMFQEMESYRDDRSEVWQEDQRGVDFQDNLDRVETALEAIRDIE